MSLFVVKLLLKYLLLLQFVSVVSPIVYFIRSLRMPSIFEIADEMIHCLEFVVHILPTFDLLLILKLKREQFVRPRRAATL